MDLTEINSVGVSFGKELKKLEDLVQDQEYSIEDIKIVNGLYGESPLIILEDCAVFLPGRALKAVKNNLEKFVSGKYKLIFRGVKTVSSNPTARGFLLFELS